METKKLTREQIDDLKKPLPPEAVTQHETKKYLSSIKAIYVIERLNDVFGIGSWKITDTVIVNDGKVFNKEDKLSVHIMIVVKATLQIPEYGIELESYGGNENQDL